MSCPEAGKSGHPRATTVTIHRPRDGKGAGSGIRSWDVFCRVVDNYGDAAVCWRLARQLAALSGAPARLWVDDLQVLHALCPEVSSDKAWQRVAGVDVCRWESNADFGSPAEIVVEGFGSGLPEPYIEAMARCSPRPLWIVLEYLSAESWVSGHHGLASPHPRLALERYFFFPGFFPGTGGLLKEKNIEARREAFQRDPELRRTFWRDYGFDPPSPEATVVSLFSYANAAVGKLLDAWACGKRPVVAAVPEGPAREQVRAFFGVADAPDGTALRCGSLEVRLLPFLPQRRYDQLLWACGWNFVRGEDSFVRAQWAAQPLIWHIYPQEARAHWVKLDAFLDVYCTGLAVEAESALRAFWHRWNDSAATAAGETAPTDMRAVWEALAPQQERLSGHARVWASRVAAAGDLAENLARFCEERLK